jgi:sec-independent protein translocase protein TatC
MPTLSPDVTPEPEGQRLSLAEHLGELRSRLLRCTLAVLVLGILGLVFARPIFGALMRPVLDALPPDQRSLIYTSGIEELNVLMKVGLYAGIFLSTPVILWQLWGFVSPGLYPAERRYAAPFVLVGSLAFLAGAAFCYFVLLPTMFRFLLTGESAPVQARVEMVQAREAEVLRLVSLGAFERAAQQATSAVGALTASGDGQVAADSGQPTSGAVDRQTRFDALGRLLDAVHTALGPQSAPALRKAMDKRLAALDAMQAGQDAKADTDMEESAALLAGAAGAQGGQVSQVWQLERAVAVGRRQLAAEAWTRPLLTMSEQLSLVLLLLLALGIIFELPLVMALLAALGVVKARFLMRYQRHAIIVCLIVAAIITPTGDAVNLSLMAGPMIACYELGVLAAWLIEKRKARNAAQTALAATG